MFSKITGVFVLLLILIGCSGPNPGMTPDEIKTPTHMAEPSATERPVAIQVNGEGVWMEEYLADMQQFQHAQSELGLTFTNEAASSRVIENLVQTTLLAQEAYTNGYELDEAAIQQEISDITASMGGPNIFNSWLSENGYTLEVFKHAYIKAEAAGWQIDRITAAVPASAEQIHARQILTISRESAEDALLQLENGYEFASLAGVYDPLTRGDLGWFPQGYLLQPLVEEAAFILEVGEYSNIIETTSGFHIIYVIERESNRELSQDALITLQEGVLKAWVDAKVSSSSVEIYVP